MQLSASTKQSLMPFAEAGRHFPRAYWSRRASATRQETGRDAPSSTLSAQAMHICGRTSRAGQERPSKVTDCRRSVTGTAKRQTWTWHQPQPLHSSFCKGTNHRFILTKTVLAYSCLVLVGICAASPVAAALEALFCVPVA